VISRKLKQSLILRQISDSSPIKTPAILNERFWMRKNWNWRYNLIATCKLHAFYGFTILNWDLSNNRNAIDILSPIILRG